MRHGDFTTAADFYRACLALEPDDAEAIDGVGGVAFSLGRYVEAAEQFQHAVSLRPESSRLLCNLGSALVCCGSPDDARVTFERAVAIDAECAMAHLNLGALALLHGDFTNGWREFEWRLGTPSQRRSQGTPWAGQSLDGASIVLEEEQGFGDTIQFCRYAPLVAHRGGRVALAVGPALAPLLAGLADVHEGMATRDAAWTCRLPSLPGIFGTDLTSVPCRVPYLRADAARVARMRAQIAAGAISVGFVWAGNPRNHHDRLRSIPLGALAPLFEVEGVTAFSLQHGPPEEERRRASDGHRLRSLARDGSTFCDTAAAIVALDLVITIDTSVAHLAGALGRPVWILLPHVPDWRWLLDTETSAWYPTARLFRQPAADRWDLLIAQVASELRSLARQPDAVG